MWECRQRYSADRWYVIGDAGDTVDPLYSVGLALSSLQIRQNAAIIQRELDGDDTREFTKDLDTGISAFQRSVTRDFTCRTQKPLSPLWKVTRSIKPEICSVEGRWSLVVASMRALHFAMRGRRQAACAGTVPRHLRQPGKKAPVAGTECFG